MIFQNMLKEYCLWIIGMFPNSPLITVPILLVSCGLSIYLTTKSIILVTNMLFYVGLSIWKKLNNIEHL